MVVTSELFAAYISCPTKCWLLWKGVAPQPTSGSGHINQMQAEYCRRQKEALHATTSAVINAQNIGPAHGCRWAADVTVRTSELGATIPAIEFIAAKSRGGRDFVPTVFVFSRKVSRGDKLLAAFCALLLRNVTAAPVRISRVVSGPGDHLQNIAVSRYSNEVTSVAAEIRSFLERETTPEVILNRHCATCEFYGHCRGKAFASDDLSLLPRMTEKERRKYRQKGIFTVTQLSYTFRSRRRGRNCDSQQKYNHALKALAIRDKKTIVIQNPALEVCGTPVYLDVEGAVDHDFYYLIGMRVGTGNNAAQLSFWADTPSEEGTIWRKFIHALERIATPVLIYYGGYEAAFLRRMSKRHGTPSSRCRRVFAGAVNLVSRLHGRIYFPCLSNGLKDIAGVLGFHWSDVGATGIDAAYWRWKWEAGHQGVLKDQLVQYNADDCAALAIVAARTAALVVPNHAALDVVHLDRRGGSSTTSQRGTNIHQAFDRMLKSAHAANVHRKLALIDPSEIEPSRSWPATKRDRNRRKLRGVTERIVRVPRRRVCPKHPGERVLLRERSREAHHHIVDIAFTKAGCRSVALHYVGRKAYCPACETMFVPPMFDALEAGRLWGRGVEALLVYLRVALRLSFRLMASVLNELWHANIAPETCGDLIDHASTRYCSTQRMLVTAILQSSVVHVDETRINILGEVQYVWVLTDGRHVAFLLTKTREARFLRPLFARFRGTLVSDFYPGYDGLRCRQQKCLSHLIRDLNDELWKNPFDVEFEAFVAAVRDLFAPMFADAARFHGNTRYLRKHLSRVARFYRQYVDRPASHDELIERFRKRFARYRRAMFTFLDHDGLPWNNNAAERALRHLAVQRKISNAFSERGAQHYLRFLAIAQSCRFQSKSFLGFLVSGLKNVDRYDSKAHR